MTKKSGKQLTVSVLGCSNLKPNTSGDPNARNIQVQLEVEDMNASTKFVSGLSPQFDDNFAVVLTSASAPTLYVNVVHKGDPNSSDSKDENLGMVKIPLGLLEDRPARDVHYNLEKKSFNQEVQGEIHLKIEYSSKVDIDADEAPSFKKTATVAAKKGGVLEFYMKEIDKLRSIETQLEKRVEAAEPQVRELAKKMERREEMIKKLEKGDETLALLKKLEDDRKELQELYKKLKAEVEEKDVMIRRKDKQIMQLEMMANQKTRMVRKMSMQMSMTAAAHPGVAAAASAAVATPRQPIPQVQDEMPPPPSQSPEVESNEAPSESEAAPNETVADILDQLVPPPVEDKAEEDEAESEDDDDQQGHPDDEDDASIEAEAKNLKGDARKWQRRFEKEKMAKIDWKDKCIELEQLYNEMLLQKQLQAEEGLSAAKKLEEIEGLREANNELKMMIKLTESQLDEAMKKYKKEAKERKKLYNEIQEMKGNIRVYCRCRPISKNELARGAMDVTAFGELDDISIFVEGGQKKTFEFDKTFDQESTQELVFEDTRPLMQSVLDGFNVCIFAYGQTGTGKTYTMQGSPENPGVNIRALIELFRLVADKGDDYIFEMAISVYEVYCDVIRDLLVPNSEKLSIRIEKRGDRVHNYIDGLSQRVVTCVDDVNATIATANANRSTASTNMNEYSSRSHLIMSVDIATIDKLSKKKTQSALHMVDLAGSERVGRSGVSGQAMKEAQAINQSLSALGNVLSALGRKDNHVPYRDSKLTHALADALGGNSKVLMFCNVSPSSDNVQESLSSLQFATRARAVELGKAVANVSNSKVDDVPAELADDAEEPKPAAAVPAAAAKPATPVKPGAAAKAAPAKPGIAAKPATSLAAKPAAAAAPAKSPRSSSISGPSATAAAAAKKPLPGRK